MNIIEAKSNHLSDQLKISRNKEQVLKLNITQVESKTDHIQDQMKLIIEGCDEGQYLSKNGTC